MAQVNVKNNACLLRYSAEYIRLIYLPEQFPL